MKNRKTLTKILAIVLSALMACTGLFTIITYCVWMASQHVH
jgi:hypothetical protein